MISHIMAHGADIPIQHFDFLDMLFTLSDFHSCYSCCDCNVSKLERDAGRTAGTRAGIKSDQ
jgi:hypothetical protein